MASCKRCKEDFEPPKGVDPAPVFCTACVKLIQEAQDARKKEKEKEKEKAQEKESSKAEKEEVPAKTGEAAELEELTKSFQEGPPSMQVCSKRIAEASKSVPPAVLIKALKATKYAAERIPGVNPDQLLYVFIEAFERNSSVVLGGSRVKSYFKGTKLYRDENEITNMGEELKKASDLDIGYGYLKPGSAGAINKKANELQPPPVEQFIIMEGQKSPTFGTLPTPEEFFHKTGKRPDEDDKSKIEPIATPSGCITFAPDGTIQENGPDVPIEKLVIPSSGRKPRSMGNI